jgi:hypothetical protein
MIAFANPQGKIESTSMNSAPLSIVSNDFMKAGDLSSIKIRERNQNQLTSENNFILPLQIPDEIKKIREQIPKNLEEVEAEILPLRNRFLMWTHDGKHIMWGYYRNGFFIGTDNLSKRAWGIYGNGIFAGFYDGDFFWGKYSRCHWKAIGLFNLDESHGKYVLFPETKIISETP